MASRRGRLSIAPAPRRKVRRGILQDCSLIGWPLVVVHRIEPVFELETGGDLLDQNRRTILGLAQGVDRPANRALVESIQFTPEREPVHLAGEVAYELIFAR